MSLDRPQTPDPYPLLPAAGSVKALSMSTTRPSCSARSGLFSRIRSRCWTQSADRARRGEKVPTPFEHPNLVDGVAGMAFVEAAVASSNQDGAWVSETERLTVCPSATRTAGRSADL